jgi:hypothetical protein
MYYIYPFVCFISPFSPLRQGYSVLDLASGVNNWIPVFTGMIKLFILAQNDIENDHIQD